MSKKTCIVISGPTAIGKTSFAIELAQKYNTQIISADSRQCYVELNNGVAKPSNQELQSVHHYFINSHSIHDEVNVKVFEQYALNAAASIFKENETVIVVGGTGLYIKAFCEGLDDVPPVNENIRNEINEKYITQGIEWLRDEIREQDPVYFSSGEIQNPQRMIRALEVQLSTGKSIMHYHSGKKITRDFDIQKIHLETPREQLYTRINKRVDDMMEAGLLQEAEGLIAFRHLNALQTVGYKELFDYMDGITSLNAAIENIKKNTRHFAKRQITWFKKNL